jgi:integrase
MRARATNVKLTKRAVDAAESSTNRYYLWDSELKGFGVKIEVSGTKTYIVRYRPKGQGTSAPKRFVTIGRHGALTAEEARNQARVIFGKVAFREDPAAEFAIVTATKTFGELVDLFLQQHVRSKRRMTTAALYECLLRKHALPTLKHRIAQTITRDEIARLHLDMQDTPYSANRLIAVIASLYTFAAKSGLVPERFNPANSIEKYPEEGRERYLTGEELERLGAALHEGATIGIPWNVDRDKPGAKHLPKDPDKLRERLDPYAVDAMRLLLFTGARLREILHLRWEFVDLERGMIFLPTSKTGRKTIVLNAAALDIIANLRELKRSSPYVIAGASDDKPRADLKKPWDAVRRRAGLEGVRLHDLRHTFASLGAGASLGLPIVGKLLGHAQPQTTARYAHLDADPLRRASNLIGEHLRAALAPKNRSV